MDSDDDLGQESSLMRELLTINTQEGDTIDVESNTYVPSKGSSRPKNLFGGLSKLSLKNEKLEVTIDVRNLDYSVGYGRNKKQILSNINARFQPGEFACLMGPSGSGKTTLLNCILGNASGKIKGEVKVNGQNIPSYFKSFAKLIPQEDVMLGTLTVRESLSFQAELVMDTQLKKSEKMHRIQNVINELSLQDCADTLIGTVETRGISGGERKRTSIALEMLSNPCLLCVDEPTSGLDSKTAEDVVLILQKLARTPDTYTGAKRTCITTIHQPSYRIFSLFSSVIFLTKGEVAYNGPVSEVENFFSAAGFPTPKKENPADHILRVLQDDDKIFKVLDYFQDSTQKADSDSATENTLGYPALRFADFEKYPTSFFHQVRVLFSRNIYDTIKDKTKFVRILAIKASVGLLMGTLWFGSANPPTNEKLFGLMGSIFMLSITSLMTILAQTIISFPLQRSLLIREYKNGVYGLLPYYIANILSMNMMGIIYTMASVTPIYFMVGLESTTENFIHFSLALIGTQAIGNALGLAVGACSADIIEAQNLLVPILTPTMLFSGFVLPRNQAPSYFSIFYNLSFFRTTVTVLAVTELHGVEFADYSPNPFKLHVFKNGDQILRYLDIDPETKVVHQIMIIFGWAALYTVLGYIIVKYFMSRKTS